MARAKRRSNIRVEPPDWLVRENKQARIVVERRKSRGQMNRTIWHDILERTDEALAKYNKPVEEPGEIKKEIKQ